MIPRSGGFISAMMVTFAAFASGMGVCLFDLDTVNACLDVANTWVDIFIKMGDHMIAWFMAILQGAKR